MLKVFNALLTLLSLVGSAHNHCYCDQLFLNEVNVKWDCMSTEKERLKKFISNTTNILFSTMIFMWDPHKIYCVRESVKKNVLLTYLKTHKCIFTFCPSFKRKFYWEFV